MDQYEEKVKIITIHFMDQNVITKAGEMAEQEKAPGTKIDDLNSSFRTNM